MKKRVPDQKEQETPLRGIPIILLSRNCFYCSHYNKRGESCKKKRPRELMYFSGIFCPDLDEYIIPPTGEINLENIETINDGFYQDKEQKIIKGRVFYFHPFEEYETPFPYLLRRIGEQEIIGDLLEDLDKIKKSSPEARRIRRELRAKGFHLKQPKEKQNEEAIQKHRIK